MSSLDQIRAAMATTNSLFVTEVIGARNIDALKNIYTTDARILPPGAPMIAGLPAIKQFWAQLIQNANPQGGELETLDAIQAGDGVVEIGRALLTLEMEERMEVKYVVHWLQESGQWKWHIDIWNQNA
jgi:ketosteroid isomerase-like protein